MHTLSRECGLWDEYDDQGRRRRRKRKVLVVANPVAGRGGGAAMLRRAERVLRLCGVPHDAIVTQRAGHAR